jgi:uncharacterized protein YukE
VGVDNSGADPEQKTVLGFPARPPGDPDVVRSGRHYWYELAGDLHGVFADIDRVIAGIQWSGDGREAFDVVWSQLSGYGNEATQHSHEMGDQLLRIGNEIEDAQQEWLHAMEGMAVCTAISIGATFVTAGLSDAFAAGTAATAVGAMEAACAALDISLNAALQVLMAAIRIAIQLGVKFTWQFSINLISQEGATLVEEGHLKKLELRDVREAAEFASVSMVIPGLTSKVTIGGKQVLKGPPPGPCSPGRPPTPPSRAWRE